jgi:hypothetical protein
MCRRRKQVQKVIVGDVELGSHCIGNAGLQELLYYYNDASSRIATTLLLNFGSNKPACEEIEGTILLTPETGSLATMFSALF